MKINKILLILIISFFCTQNLYAYDNLPNDPELEKLFYLQNIKALNAWEINAKSPDVVVAVIDTGVDIYNPDLEGNIWINTDEVMADGIDNDENFVHRGIAKRTFSRQFNLSDDIIVKNADFKDGMLIVNLERVIPDEKKPRLIPIGQ